MNKVLLCLLSILIVGCSFNWHPMTNWTVEGSYQENGGVMEMTSPTTLTFNESISAISFDQFEWKAKVRLSDDGTLLLSFPSATEPSGTNTFLLVPNGLTPDEYKAVNKYNAKRIDTPTNKWITVGISFSPGNYHLNISTDLHDEDLEWTVSKAESSESTETLNPNNIQIKLLSGTCALKALKIR